MVAMLSHAVMGTQWRMRQRWDPSLSLPNLSLSLFLHQLVLSFWNWAFKTFWNANSNFTHIDFKSPLEDIRLLTPLPKPYPFSFPLIFPLVTRASSLVLATWRRLLSRLGDVDKFPNGVRCLFRVMFRELCLWPFLLLRTEVFKKCCAVFRSIFKCVWKNVQLRLIFYEQYH